LLAVAAGAAAVVAGLGVYFFRSQPTPRPVVAALPGGGVVAVVHHGPAVLASTSLTGASSVQKLTIPGAPSSMVTTPDGSRAFLLDSTGAQVIPVDLTHGTVGTPIPAGKLPTDEQLSADGSTLFVTDNLGGAVVAIDTATGKPGPAQQLVQGVASFTPSPTGTGAVISAFSSAGQPGAMAFYSSASGIGKAIQVGFNSPTGVFYSRDGATVWVTEDGVGSEPGALIPITVASHAVGSPIAVGHGPGGAAMSTDGRTMIVTNSLDRNVSVVDLQRRAVVATIPVGSGPAQVRIAPDGLTAWVACVLDRTLVPIDLTTHTSGKAVALADAPSDLSLIASGRAAWVLFTSSAGNITELTAGNSLGRAMPVGSDPNLLIAHDSATGWVANAFSDSVQRLDLGGQSIGAPVGVAALPSELKLTPDGRALFVLSFGDGTHPGFLTSVDTASSRPSRPLPVGTAPTSLTVAPDGSTVYIANHQANSVVTVDVKSWTVGKEIALPCSPSQLLITPDGTGLYANCTGAAEVIPVATKDRSVGAPITVGSSAVLVMGNQGRFIFVNANHELQEIEVATNKVVLSHDETGNIVGIAPTPDDTTLVAVENTGGSVLLINAATLVTSSTLSVGARPGGLRLSPDGSRAYVLDTSTQKLYVVDVVGSKVAATLDVGPHAASVVVAPRLP
jgi:YVTN family beta-propeller protein